MPDVVVVGHEWPTYVGGCFGGGAGNVGATPPPALPRCASLWGRG